MELCKEFKPIDITEEKETFCESFELDFQENLPQYLDDINKIINCTVNCAVTDYECTGSSIKLYGKSIISITYCNANNELASTVFEEDFSKAINTSANCSLNFAKINLVTNYHSHRLINQRRIDIHISLKAHISAFSKTNEDVLSNCKNAYVREYKPQILCEATSGVSNQEFDEIFPIIDNSSPIKNIVNTFVNCHIDDRKIIKDKMLVKTVVEVSVLYENENSTIEKCVHSFSISKIIEIPDCCEDDKSFISVDVSAIYVKAKPDISNKLIEIEAVGKITFNYLIYSNCEKSLLTDSYFVKHNSKIETKSIKLKTNPLYFYDDSSNELTFTLDEDLSEILDVKISVINAYIEESKLIYLINFNCAYYNDRGEIGFFQKQDEAKILLLDKPLNGICSLNLLSYDYIIKNSNTVSLRINFEYSAYLYEQKEISIIKDLELNGEKDIASLPELTLYFAQKGESVWEIAKKFSTNMSLIMEENNLNSQVIDSQMVLLVPGM